MNPLGWCFAALIALTDVPACVKAGNPVPTS
jgi:hypothetical protein